MDLEFELQGLPKTPNQLLRRHWGAIKSERAKWHNKVHKAVDRAETYPKSFARVFLTRHSARSPDKDNLYASFKFVLDALVKAGVITDDTPESIYLRCFWEKAKQRHGRVSVKVSWD